MMDLPKYLKTRVTNRLIDFGWDGKEETLATFLAVRTCREISNMHRWHRRSHRLGSKSLEALLDLCRERGWKLSCGCPEPHVGGPP